MSMIAIIPFTNVCKVNSLSLTDCEIFSKEAAIVTLRCSSESNACARVCGAL